MMKSTAGAVLAAWLVAALLATACDNNAAPKPAASAAPTTTTAATTASAAAAEPAQLQESRRLIQRFATTLKGELMKGMSAGGPAAAVTACNERAPRIATELEPAEGWSIRRTSLKLRNPANAPDAWERQTLERFEAERRAGKDADALEAFAVLDEAGGKSFRYMKAIPTAAMCLSCHGHDIPAEVASELKQRYPEDQATGFAVGDVRGAFSVKKRL